MSSQTLTDNSDPLVDDRSNYKRWPWASFLVVGLSVGAIFFMASGPTMIGQAKGGTLALQIFFLACAIIVLIPSVLITFILVSYCFIRAIGCNPPKFVRRFFRRLYKRQKSSIHKSPTSRMSIPCVEDTGRPMSGSPFPISLQKMKTKPAAFQPDNEEPVWSTHKHRSQPGYTYPTENIVMPQEKWIVHPVEQTTAIVHELRNKSPPTIIVQRTDSDSSYSEDTINERSVDSPMVKVEAQPVIIRVNDTILTERKAYSSSTMEYNNNNIQAPITATKDNTNTKSNHSTCDLELTNDSQALVHRFSGNSSDEVPINSNNIFSSAESIPLKNLTKVQRTGVKSIQQDTLHEQRLENDEKGLLSDSTRKSLNTRSKWNILKAATHLKVFMSPDNDMQNPRKGQMWKDSSGNIVLM